MTTRWQKDGDPSVTRASVNGDGGNAPPHAATNPRGRCPRFVPLPVDLLELIERHDLDNDAISVLCYLRLRAKVFGDNGVVWTCSPTIAAAIRNLTPDRAKRALADLKATGLIKELRQEGSRGNYPIVIDGYLRFDEAARQWLLTNAGKTASSRDPVFEPARQDPPRPPRQPAPRDPRQNPPPCIEPGTGTKIPPPPSGSGGAPGGAGPIQLSPDELADIWKRRCPSLSQPDRPLAVGVRKELERAIRRDRDRDWDATFARICRSPKLRGEDFNWKCPGIVWATTRLNLAKLDAGEYDPSCVPEKREPRVGPSIPDADEVIPRYDPTPQERAARAASRAKLLGKYPSPVRETIAVDRTKPCGGVL